ncbi:hypothetical protein LCGC14_2947780 [marine sediment metagenome]|uniref:Uncharacterized protein n=1 Tax=marine sediment metagenome TaxID=412755 RepID=A0A0F8ZNW1_9ZZZZ
MSYFMKWVVYIFLLALLGGTLGVLLGPLTWQFWLVDIPGIFIIQYFIFKDYEPTEKKEPLLKGINDIEGKPIRGIDYE